MIGSQASKKQSLCHSSGWRRCLMKRRKRPDSESFCPASNTRFKYASVTRSLALQCIIG